MAVREAVAPSGNDMPAKLYTGVVSAKVVKPPGRAIELVEITSEPKSLEHEGVTWATIQRWKISPPYERCSPLKSALSARFAFSVVDGTQTVAITHDQPQIGPEKPSVRIRNARHVKATFESKLPLSARPLGKSTTVLLWVMVDPTTLTHRDAKVIQIDPSGRHDDSISNAAIEGLRAARFALTAKPRLGDEGVEGCIKIELESG